MRNMDVGALTSVFELLQQHYPERLSQLWFLNAPWIFWGLWKVVKPFIHEATRQKIVFLSGPEKQRMLDEHIPAHVRAAATICCCHHENTVTAVHSMPEPHLAQPGKRQSLVVYLTVDALGRLSSAWLHGPRGGGWTCSSCTFCILLEGRPHI